MASSRCNSSTLVPLLGTPFNTISYFSDQMAYLPNVPWCSRWIHQRDCSFLRSPSSTIQPSQIVLFVPGPSTVTADNDPNWKDAPTNPSTNNNTANRLTFSTYSWSKHCQSNNTNEQLAKVLGRLTNTLNPNQTPGIKIVDGRLCFYFLFSFIFFSFLFLEQLGLGSISHAVTSVTNWWHSHKTDHKTWENGVEGSGTK